MSVSPPVLPALPGMLARAVPTVVRSRRKLESDPADLHATFRTGSIDISQLNAYRQQFGGFISDIPLTYFYLIAQRAHLAIMLTDDFPWPVLGMVHVANRMEWVDEVKQDLPFELEVSIKMPARAATKKRVRPVYQVTFRQNGKDVVSCQSVYQTEAKEKKPKQRSRTLPAPDLHGLSRAAQWQMTSATGRSYARLSGDYNPIHLHSWLSRWFGFERPIIHGMYSVGRAQADIERVTGRPVKMMDIGFRRPLILPAEALCWHTPFESESPAEANNELQNTGRVVVTNARQDKSFLEGEFQV